MAGAFSKAVTAPAGPLTGLVFVVSAVIFIISITLAARIVIALERARRKVVPTAEWPGWRDGLKQLRTGDPSGDRQSGTEPPAQRG